MKLTAKCDVEVPLAFVYQCVTDFAAWERAAIRRGTDVERPVGLPLTGIGAAWRIRFPYRGRVRKALITIDDLAPNQTAAFSLDSPSMFGDSVIEVQALSARRTRIRVALTAKPKTLAARLFLNTLRLAKGRVTKQFDLRVAQLGADIEAHFQRNPSGGAKV
jgi:hypothetical protein